MADLTLPDAVPYLEYRKALEQVDAVRAELAAVREQLADAQTAATLKRSIASKLQHELAKQTANAVELGDMLEQFHQVACGFAFDRGRELRYALEVGVAFYEIVKMVASDPRVRELDCVDELFGHLYRMGLR